MSNREYGLDDLGFIAEFISKEEGFRCDVNYPGYLSVYHLGREWCLGDANGPMEGYESNESEPIEGTEIIIDDADNTTVAKEIVSAIRQQIKEEERGPVTDEERSNGPKGWREV